MRGSTPSKTPNCTARCSSLEPQWRKILHEADAESAVSLDRKYTHYNLLADTLPRATGEVAECGVYRGGTAVILAELAAQSGRQVHLFDTFGGMPKTNP